MAAGKKASAKAVKAASKLSGQELGKSAHWAQVFDIFMDGFVWDIMKKCDPDITVVQLFREPGEKTDLVQEFSFPNSEAWNSSDGIWDWNYVWRALSEWLMANRKKVLKPARSSRRKKR